MRPICLTVDTRPPTLYINKRNLDDLHFCKKIILLTFLNQAIQMKVERIKLLPYNTGGKLHKFSHLIKRFLNIYAGKRKRLRKIKWRKPNYIIWMSVANVDFWAPHSTTYWNYNSFALICEINILHKYIFPPMTKFLITIIFLPGSHSSLKSIFANYPNERLSK